MTTTKGNPEILLYTRIRKSPFFYASRRHGSVMFSVYNHTKDALKRIKAEGVHRMLAGVEIGGVRLGAYNDGSMIDFFPVRHGGVVVGRVTSACWSPRLKKNIGFAMVPIELSELGTELEVETPIERTSAVVVQKPFIDPKKETPKQDFVSVDRA